MDENVSYGLVERLRNTGHYVIAMAETEKQRTEDASVFEIACREKAILITRDYHFTNPFRFAPERTEGIIYIHQGNLKSEEEIGMVIKFIESHPHSFFKKRLVTLYRKSVKIREGFNSI